jgi:hypothetical protein
MCRLSINLGASTSWNSKGLSRPVMGLLYLTSNIVARISTCSKSVVQFIPMRLHRCSSTEAWIHLKRKEAIVTRSPHFTCRYFINGVLNSVTAVSVNSYRTLSVFIESERSDVSFLLHLVPFFHWPLYSSLQRSPGTMAYALRKSRWHLCLASKERCLCSHLIFPVQLS